MPATQNNWTASEDKTMVDQHRGRWRGGLVYGVPMVVNANFVFFRKGVKNVSACSTDKSVFRGRQK